jgi:hypothetical protein
MVRDARLSPFGATAWLLAMRGDVSPHPEEDRGSVSKDEAETLHEMR